MDTLRGHTNNVSCVLFHPKRELIVSNSEDKSIRIWDMSKSQGPQVWRRENDRFWILAAHPQQNLLAAGHDSGMVVFKLNRERPASDVGGRHLFYYKYPHIRMFDFKTGHDVPMVSTRRPSASSGAGAQFQPRTLHYNSSNPMEHNVLLVSTADGGFYELYNFPAQRAARGKHHDTSTSGTSNHSHGGVLKGHCKAVSFLSRNRFAVLVGANQISVKNLKNETKNKINLPRPNVRMIFPAGIGRLLLRSRDSVALFHVQSRQVDNVLPTPSRYPVKYVVWARKHRFCALLCKYCIYITDEALNGLSTVIETSRIKSARWDTTMPGVLIYTTSSHIKYALANGQSAIIRTLETPVYLTAAMGASLHALDRDVRNRQVRIDLSEIHFKLALASRNQKQLTRIIKQGKLVGKSTIIAYLRKQGFPEVALHFVSDNKTKFSLALECGNITVARNCALELNDNDCWLALGVAALRQGNNQVVQLAYQQTKDFARLSFLYLIIGNTLKLGKMLEISQYLKDIMSRFHNALYLGNVEERIAVLEQCGERKLAYVCARIHGLDAVADALAESLAEAGEEVPDADAVAGPNPVLLFPPIPILRQENWPLVAAPVDEFQQIDLNAADDGEDDEDKENEEDDEVGDDEDDAEVDLADFGDDDVSAAAAAAAVDDAAADAAVMGVASVDDWGGDLDLDLGLDDIANDGDAADAPAAAPPADVGVVLPVWGNTMADRWSDASNLACDQVAAGNFSMAMQLLRTQAGIVNFEPLRPHFEKIYEATRALTPTLIDLPTMPIFIGRESAAAAKPLPRLVYDLTYCVGLLKLAYKSVTAGQFPRALELFIQILHTIPFLGSDSAAEKAELVGMVDMAREYITAMRVELARRAEPDPVKQAQLATLFARCSMQPVHVFLALRIAVKAHYKVDNFKSAAIFCRRSLELCVSSNLPANLVKSTGQLRQVLKVCDSKPHDKHDLAFGVNNASHICCATFGPVDKLKPHPVCPFCSSRFVDECDGKVCDTCQLAKVGADATGLPSLSSKK